MQWTEIANALNFKCHATAIHAFDNVQDKLSIQDARYVYALNQWRIIFDMMSDTLSQYTERSAALYNELKASISFAQASMEGDDIRKVLINVLADMELHVVNQ